MTGQEAARDSREAEETTEQPTHVAFGWVSILVSSSAPTNSGAIVAAWRFPHDITCKRNRLKRVSTQRRVLIHRAHRRQSSRVSPIKCEFYTYNLHDTHLYTLIPGEWDAREMGLDRESD